MAAPKKKKAANGSVKKDEVWNWNPARHKAAQLLSEGTMNCQEVASAVHIAPATLSMWKQNINFNKEVDKLTMEHQWASKAGLMRLAFKGIVKNDGNLRDDKNTTLDWAKFIVDLLPEDTRQSDDKLTELTDAILASARK